MTITLRNTGNAIPYATYNLIKEEHLLLLYNNLNKKFSYSATFEIFKSIDVLDLFNEGWKDCFLETLVEIKTHEFNNQIDKLLK